jgi:hypothetical protein
VRYVNATREKQSNLQAPSNRFLIPPDIWKDISMDFIVGLPKLGNKSVIMVVVDHLSKYAHFCALHHPFTHPRWPKFSWIRSSSFMACQTLLFLTGPNFHKQFLARTVQSTRHTITSPLSLSSPDRWSNGISQQVFGNLSEVLCLLKTTPVGSMVTPR